MARIEISGLGIEYELLGEPGAPAIAITPGGRFSKDAAGIRELGQALEAEGRRVLLWDRPNCGASDICFEGDSESRLQAQVLCELIQALDLGPIALAGGSSGSRVSLLAAAQRPELVSHLIMWWISGGISGLLMLASYYCCESVVAASMGGMERVAAMPIWAEQIERNPKSRDFILGQDPDQFIARMEKWAAGYIPTEDSPLPSTSNDDLARISMPVMIFRGSPTDIFHPAYICEMVHRLIPHSQLVDAPWPDDVFARRMLEGGGLFADCPVLAPAIAKFTAP